MTFVLNISVSAFNFVKYIIVSLGLGILSEAVGDALERVRRSMSLLQEGRVLIGARKNRLFRTVSFGASPSVLICSILLTVAILASEASLEFCTDSVSIGFPIKANLKSERLHDIRRISSHDLTHMVIEPVLLKADICATKMGDMVAAWATSLYTLDTGDSMTERVNCPRNVTTSHLLGNIASARALELGSLRNETVEMTWAFGGSVRPSFDGLFMVANVSLNISGRFSEIWSNFSVHGPTKHHGGTGYQILGLMPLEGKRTNRPLDCLVCRSFTKKAVTNHLHGCARLSRDGTRYVFYQNRESPAAQSAINEVWNGPLLGATMTESKDSARRGQVLSAGMRQCHLHPPLMDVLFLSILGRMADEDELAQRPARTTERVIGFREILRPAVEEWAVAVFFGMIIALAVMAVSGNYASQRIFPIHKMVGEQNLLRKWALEKETARYGGKISGKLGDINEKRIWLCSERVKDEQRITVCSGDPEHRTVEINALFTHEASETLVRN